MVGLTLSDGASPSPSVDLVFGFLCADLCVLCASAVKGKPCWFRLCRVRERSYAVTPPLFETVPFREEVSGSISYHCVGAIAARLFNPASGGCAAQKPSGAISEVRRPAGGQHPVRARGATPGGRRALRHTAPEARSAAAHVRGARQRGTPLRHRPLPRYT